MARQSEAWSRPESLVSPHRKDFRLLQNAKRSKPSRTGNLCVIRFGDQPLFHLKLLS